MRYLTIFILFFITNYANAQVKTLSLNELNQRITKGNDTTYVINFWATWCGPCVDELPSFEKLQLENKNKPFKVILMSLDFKSKLKSEVIPFVQKNKIQTEVYVIQETDQQAFIDHVDKKWSGTIPATLFFNNQKQIRLFYERPFATYKELTNKVASLKL
ncbi:MAG: redoxin domain-containing protein [Pedobacter sp.]|nr:MAG: redoxin domain-containing protein [Pedobacter sp.]